MSDSAPLRLLPFYCGEQAFCVDLTHLRGIERADGLRFGADGIWLPGAAEDIPVLDLSATLFPERGPVRSGRVLVFHTGSAPRAMLVERLGQAFVAPQESLHPMPKAAQGRFAGLRQVAVDREELLLAIDPRISEDNDGSTRPDSKDSRLSNRAPAAGPPRLMTFTSRSSANALRFGLSLRQVAEILLAPRIFAVPGASDGLLGLVLWRQRPVPVVHLDARLSGKAEDAPQLDRLLVAWTGRRDDAIAFPVRRDVRIHDLPVAHEPCRQPLELDTSLAHAVFEMEDRQLVIPNLHRLAAVKEPTSI